MHRIKRMLGALAIAIAFVAARASASAQAPWTLEPVDIPTPTMAQPEVVVRPDGACHVAYFSAGELKYAVRSPAGAWTLETVVAAANASSRLTLALASNGDPRIAWQTVGTPNNPPVRYVERSNGAWSAVMTPGNGEAPSLAVEPGGTVHLVYCVYLNTTRHATHVPGNLTWQPQPNVFNAFSWWPTLLLRPSTQQPLVVANVHDVYFAEKNGASWTSSLVTSEPGAGYGLNPHALDLDPLSDQPTVVFYNSANQIRLARRQGFGWQIETPPLGTVGVPQALRLRSDGQPSLVFADTNGTSPYDLRYAEKIASGGWVGSLIQPDALVSVAAGADLELLPDGTPVVAFTRYESGLHRPVLALGQALVPQADLWVDPTSIALSVVVGAPSPSAVMRTVKNVGDHGSVLSWSVMESPSSSWVYEIPSSGTVVEGALGQNCQFSFATTNLSEGQHSTTLRFKNDNDPSDYVDIPVTIDVIAPPTADLGLDLCPTDPCTRIERWTQPGGSAPAAEFRQVLNLGPPNSLLRWRAKRVPPNAAWLELDNYIGAAAGGSSNSITIQFTPGSLANGVYDASLLFENIDDLSDSVTLPFRLTVSPPAPGQGANSVQVGGLTVRFDNSTVQGSIWTVSGNVSIENLIGIDGSAVIDTTANTLQTSATLTLLSPAGPIPLLSGNVQLGAHQSQLTLAPGAGLNHALRVGGLEVEIDRIDVFLAPVRGIGIGGSLVFPAELGHVKATINNLSWMEDTQRFDFAGVVDLPSATIPGTPWSVESLQLGFDSVGGNFLGTGTFVCAQPAFSVDASARIIGGQLDLVAASYSGSNQIPIGTTPFAIRGMGAAVSGFVQPPLSLSGSLDLTTHPSIPIPGNQVNVLTADVEMRLTVPPTWSFQLDGAAMLFEPVTPISGDIFGWEYDYAGLPLANVHSVLDPSGFYGAAQLNFLDVLVGNAWMTLRGDPLGGVIDVDGFVNGAIQIPAGWPLGPATLAQSDIRFNNTGVTASGYVGPIAVTLRVTADGRIEFLDGQSESFSLNVPAGMASVLFRARPYGGVLDQIHVVSPSGVVFTPQNSPVGVPDLGATTQIGSYLGSMGSDGSRWFAVQNPEPGLWDLVALGQQPTVEATRVLGNVRPRVDVTGPAIDVVGTSVLVSYGAFDPDDVAAVRYYLDQDDVGLDGVALTQADVEGDGHTSRQLDLSAHEAGEYRLLVEVDDGRSAPARAYAPGRVTVKATSTLAAPTMVVATPDESSQLRVRWNPVSGASGYRLSWGTELAADIPNVSSLLGAGATEARVAVAPGQKYWAQVHATDGAGARGLPSAKAVALVEDPVANDAPVFVGAGRFAVRAGAPLAFRALAFDADFDPLAFSVSTGPAGLAVDPVTGVVTWTPGAEQIGTVPFQLQVGDGSGAVGLRDYTVEVVAPTNPDLPPVVFSQPITTGSVANTYEYDIAAFDPDGGGLTFMLEEGPVGMTLHATGGLLRWLPNAGQIGGHAVGFRVTDAAGAVTRQRFTLEVAGAPSARVVALGGVVSGALASGGLESVVFEATSGSSVSFRAITTGGNFTPRVRIFHPRGRLAADFVGDGAATLDATGLYRMDIQTTGIAAGSWALQSALRYPRELLHQAPIASGAFEDFAFEGLPGRRIDTATVRKASGQLLPRVELIDPAGKYTDLTYYETSSAVGNLITLAGLPLTALGTWRLRVYNDAQVGGQASVRVRFSP
jgi:hypothetical protein